MASPKPTPALPVGTVWEIAGPGKGPTTVTRPNGDAVVISDPFHVLTIPGGYTAARDGKPVAEVEAVADADPA